MKTNHENYKILRSQHVVFVLRESQTGSEFIALPENTPDTDVARIAKCTPPDGWRKLETINFDSLQSNNNPPNP